MTPNELDGWKAKLKAFFAAQFYNKADLYGPDWSEMTAGDLEGFSLEAVNEIIDAFDPKQIG